MESEIGRVECLPQPEPGLTEARLVERAAGLRSKLREQQADSDRRGCYSEEIHEAFRSAGFYRILQPRMFGGYELAPRVYARVVMELSRGHPGAAWCFTLAGSHGFFVASHFPEAVQRELFGPAGEFRSPQVAGPCGTMRPVAGGYIVDGLFPFASGIPVSTHFIGGSLAPTPGGPPRHVAFVLERKDVEVLNDWGEGRFLGMQASGSNTVRVNGKFVPDRHVVGLDMLTSSEHAPQGTYGYRLHGNPMYTGVLLGWFNAEFAAILTGAAWAALDEFEDSARTKSLFGNPALKRMQDPFVQNLFGNCKALVEAAQVLTLEATDRYLQQAQRAAAESRPVTTRDTFEVWGLAQQACRLAGEAVTSLFHASGAATGRSDQRMQRYFRDIETYRLHIQSQPNLPTARGKVEFGLAKGIFD